VKSGRIPLSSLRQVVRRIAGGGLLVVAPLATITAQHNKSKPDSIAAVSRTIQALGARGDAAGLAGAYRRMADLLSDVDSTTRALEAYRHALDNAASVRDSTTLAAAHSGIGLLHWGANRYDSALTHLSRARTIRERTGDRTGLGVVLNSIGASYYQLGQYEPALIHFLQSIAISREVGDQRRAAVTLINIGKTYHDFGQYDRAADVLHQALRISDSVRAPLVRGYALHTLASLLMDLGRLADARGMFHQSLAAYSDSSVSRADSLSGWSMNAVVMGRLLVREGNAAAAVRLLDSVRVVAERRGSVRGQSRALLHMGEAYRALGRYDRAERALERSLALSRSVEQRVFAFEALKLLSRVKEEAGQTVAALDHLRAASALNDTIFNQATSHRIAAMEARDAADREQRENARLRAEQAVQQHVIARQRSAVTLGALVLLLTLTLLVLVYHFLRQGKVREVLLERANSELARTNRELQRALTDVRTLSGLIPMCAGCKRVRDDQGYWEAVETFISNRSSATFSHGICSSCGPELYGEHWHAEAQRATGGDEG